MTCLCDCVPPLLLILQYLLYYSFNLFASRQLVQYVWSEESQNLMKKSNKTMETKCFERPSPTPTRVKPEFRDVMRPDFTTYLAKTVIKIPPLPLSLYNLSSHHPASRVCVCHHEPLSQTVFTPLVISVHTGQTSRPEHHGSHM